MFGDYDKKSISVGLNYDPAADDDIAIWRVAQAAVITDASFVINNTLAGSTANYFDMALYNGGPAGTAVAAIGGTIGGTAGWVGMTPKTFTITNGTVAAGDVVYARYNEEGTGTFTAGVLSISYKLGSN